MQKTATAEPVIIDDDPLTDDEIAQGFYTHSEMVALGIVKDRQDQRRQADRLRLSEAGQDRGPPSSQFPKARVHRWMRQRDALSRTLQK